MSRKDLIKSLLRSAVNTAAEQLKRIGLPDELQQRVQDILKLRIAISDQQLTAAAGRAAGILAVTVAVTEGRIRIDAGLEGDRRLVLSLIPLGAAFAPRGAKELSFSVDPPAAANDPCAPELVGAIAAEIARAIWGPFLSRSASYAYPALVERENDLMRVDLRTAPELRAALRRRGLASAIELLTAKELTAEPGALRIRLGIHQLL